MHRLRIKTFVVANFDVEDPKSSTKDLLDEQVNEWLACNPNIKIQSTHQSTCYSDEYLDRGPKFVVTLTIFYTPPK